jgi:NAD(P)-dependent dehydrogenase (short-subunit alcohol dehydrogenase family)
MEGNMSKTALVTGANRGIGLELARALQRRGDRVIAVCRKPSPELAALDVRVEAGVDVTAADAPADLARRLEGVELDLLVQNAGILERTDLDSLDIESVRRQLEVNAIAPLRLTHALLPRVRRGGKIALMTSLMGSIGDNGSGGSYGYRMSKAALNAAGVSLARDLAPRDIAVVLLHPGFVATAMTGNRGNWGPAEAAVALLARIDELTVATTGRFVHATGRELPW